MGPNMVAFTVRRRVCKGEGQSIQLHTVVAPLLFVNVMLYISTSCSGTLTFDAALVGAQQVSIQLEIMTTCCFTTVPSLHC